MRKIVLFCFILTVAAVSLAQGEKTLLLRQPAIGRNLIAFEYGNEIWIAPRSGGDARPLTTGQGVKSTPFISPDGTSIAYTGAYDGNTDVYVVAADGGEAKRLTHHPGADVVMGWSPDSKAVLFRSARNSYNGFNRMFTVPVQGGLPHEVPLPTAEAGCFSPDGLHLAYVPVTNWYQGIAWKRYRGGRTARIWVADLKDSSTVEIPRDNSNDINPMWIGGKVYFLSDRNGAVTLFSYDVSSKAVDQLLPANGADIITASAGPGVIVLERVGALQVYDLQTKKVSDINIRVAGDLPSLRPHFVKVTDEIRNYSLSPSGVRAVFEAHGEILTVPAEKGDIRNLTNTPSVAERDPAWSPDGKQLAYFSDEGGEYSLRIQRQDGMGETKTIKLSDSPSFFYNPQWSPDGKKILYTDKHLNLWYLELANPKPVLVDTDYYQTRTMEPAWAPDSKWIAYVKQTPSHMRSVQLYSLETSKKTEATDGMSDAGFPQFDKNGKYLYFLASTDVGPSQSGIDLSILSHSSTRSAYVMVLRKDLPSPLAPESDEEGKDAEKSDSKPDTPPASLQQPDAKPAGGEQSPAEGGKPDAKPADKKPVVVKVDFDGIDQRILALPIPARDFTRLIAGASGTLFLVEAPDRGAAVPGGSVQRFDLASRKTTKLLDGISAFTVSANGKKMLYRQGPPRTGKWSIASVPPPPPASGAPQGPEAAAGPRINGEPLKLDAMQVLVDPHAEWQQMYHEAWRIERDFFYDPNLHGVDWRKYEARYQPYIAALSSREDLDYVFTDMLGELTVGHMFIRGPQPPDQTDQPRAGLLGADYRVENGRYRFSKVYEGENWNPGLRAPLTEPGVNVKSGDYLLEVNGRELKGADEIFELFEGTANKQTVLKVAADASPTSICPTRRMAATPTSTATSSRSSTAKAR